MVQEEESSGRNRWESRRFAYLAVLTLINLGPAAAAVAISVELSRVYPRPRSDLGLVLWVLGLGAVSVVIVFGVDRAVRRLLPLATLLKLTLVFPDRAPSRFRSAIRSTSVRDLEHRLQEARESGRRGETLNDAAIRIVELAAMLTAHDRRTRGHSERVRAYAEMMAEELHLPSDDRDKLRWGALLHDIGKLAVPAEILNKNGRPDPDEWEAIKRHPAEAEHLLEPLKEWLGPWANAAWEHHERWDGKGYPRGIAGDRITVAGRLVAVADSFEVMTATRAYKKPLPAAVARQELQNCAGTQFDPEMVRALLNVSMTRLRREMGALAWLAQLPLLSWTVPAASSAPAALATVGRAAALAGALQTVTPGGLVNTTATAPAAKNPPAVLAVDGTGTTGSPVSSQFADVPTASARSYPVVTAKPQLPAAAAGPAATGSTTPSKTTSPPTTATPATAKKPANTNTNAGTPSGSASTSPPSNSTHTTTGPTSSTSAPPATGNPHTTAAPSTTVPTSTSSHGTGNANSSPSTAVTTPTVSTVPATSRRP